MRFLRLHEVCRVTGLSRALIYRLSENRLPRSVRKSAVGWIEHEVQAWLAKRMKQSRARLAWDSGAIRANMAYRDGQRIELATPSVAA